jgi:zinc/manganese transport system substrate-binding protein
MVEISRRRFITAAVAALGSMPLTRRAAEARTLRHVASSTDLVSIAQEIARDRIQGQSFFRGDQEPELWVEEVFPSWIVRASRADLLTRIGLFADIWMDTVIESAGNRRIVPGAPGYVDASERIAVLEIPGGPVDRSLGEIHVQGNPHYLLDPLNAKIVADNILKGLVRIVPEASDEFRRNTRAFSERIDAALPRWETAADAIRGKKLAAYHKTWSYLARRFGFIVVGYCEPKPGIEPSPADIGQLVETMAREQARLIIHEPVYSPRIPQAVARDVQRRTGQAVSVLKLPAHVGGVSEAADYFTFIDYLLAALGRALG